MINNYGLTKIHCPAKIPITWQFDQCGFQQEENLQALEPASVSENSRKYLIEKYNMQKFAQNINFSQGTSANHIRQIKACMLLQKASSIGIDEYLNMSSVKKIKCTSNVNYLRIWPWSLQLKQQTLKITRNILILKIEKRHLNHHHHTH